MANVGGSSRAPKAPERREGHWGPSQMEEADFEAFYTEYRFPRETRFRLPSASETPYTIGAKGEMCFFEAPLKSGGFLPITSYPDTNKGWHDRYFFMSGVGWERFPGEDLRGESSLCWVFGSVPDHCRRDVTGLTPLEQAHVDAILQVGSIDWNALVCRENEGWLGHTMSEPSPRANPSPRSERGTRERLSREDSRKESSRASAGGTFTKLRFSREAEGSSQRHSSRKRRRSPPVASEVEEVEAEEASLARTSSKRGTSSGPEDVAHTSSPSSGIRTGIPVPAVKEIREIGTPSFGISLAAPSVYGGLPSPPRTSNPTATTTPVLPGISTAERSETDEEDRSMAPSGSQHAVLLPDSTSSGGLDLPEVAGGFEVQSGMVSPSGAQPSIPSLVAEPLLEQPRTSGTVVIGGSSASAVVLAGDSTAPAADVAGGTVVLPAHSVRGKEPVTCPSPSDDVGESDSEPSAPPLWRSRPYVERVPRRRKSIA
ncbi:hypothetical protein CJ030_MR2G009206 [Morella rubra]|uniref:Uncharacterized protein n=1 Tax=Morella rubra TaxID=262757 RepID=A0A6A1WG47_9ROSI|nr:hypothetical protein CJ030_MR2G009206 [Morella rubra]